ncbi:MAG TPA: ABC transporter permease subunit [Paracoccaceae bacterium]|nr:ABC transporter permease subunit [Paracoccaceae bacterium]
MARWPVLRGAPQENGAGLAMTIESDIAAENAERRSAGDGPGLGVRVARLGAGRGGELAISAGVVVLVLVLWWAIRYFDLLGFVGITTNPDLFVPTIAATWEEFLELGFGEGYRGRSLWEHLGWSMLRMAIGVGSAIVLGIAVGIAIGVSRKVKAAVDPVIEFYRPLPPLGYYTLLIVWFGIDETPKILLLFLAAFAPVVVGTEAGIRNVRRSWVDQALTLGASRMYIFRHVMMPAALPQIFAAIRLAVGFAYTTLVAAELVAATKGIGWMVLDASKFLRIDVIYVGIIVMGITALLLDRVIRTIENRCVPWRGYA